VIESASGWAGAQVLPTRPATSPKECTGETYLRLMDKLTQHSLDALRSTDKWMTRLNGQLASMGLT